MTSQHKIYRNKNRKEISLLSSTPTPTVFDLHPFVAQFKSDHYAQQPSLKTSLIQAEKYGHHLSKTNLTNYSNSAPIQSKPDNQTVQLYRYVSTQDRDSNNYQLGNQVNYGPDADLDNDQRQLLRQHYGNEPGVLNRRDQYNSSHRTYVNAAQNTGRQLTPQELTAQNTGRNAPNASINHIIASGSGQNVINHETLRFNQGVNRFNQAQAQAQAQENDNGGIAEQAAAVALARRNEQARRNEIRRGIAEQAAAVGRVQGYNRAIINERHGENLINNPINRRIYGPEQIQGRRLDALVTRNQALRHTLTAFQGNQQDRRYQAYRDVLRMTYDSPGNLRVGDDYGNNQVSTGFDAPLNQNGVPTERANRLLSAHQNYAPDRLLINARLFSHDAAGNRLSSSQIGQPPVNNPSNQVSQPPVNNPPNKRRRTK